MVENELAVNQAIAQLSDGAWRLLRDVHAGRRHDGPEAAARQLREVTEIARATGIELDQVPAYRTNSAYWRAIARLASAPGGAQQKSQAG